MLRISKRTCRLGEKYAGKVNGDDDSGEFLSLKVELQNIVMTAEELNVLVDDPTAFDRLFRVDDDGVATPAFGKFKPLEHVASWEGAHVVLFYDDARVELKQAKLTKLRVCPRHGGEAWLSCTVEGEPVLDRKFAGIVGCMGEAIECEIRADRPDAQQSLPINNHDGAKPTPTKQGTH